MTIDCWSSSPTIQNCLFFDNRSGGVICNDGSPHVINCVFDTNDNYSVASYYTGSAPVIIGCTFMNNVQSAVYAYQGDADIINCMFWGNHGSSGAGAIALDSGASANIVNCTIVDNSGSTSAGGISCSSSYPNVVNCIVRDNSPGEIAGATPTVSYSNVKGGFAGDGNIDLDPLFLDPNTGDYRIGPASPCIDAGDNGAVWSEIETDIDGNPRFVDDPFTDDTGLGDPPIVDMGANEYQADATGMWVYPSTALDAEGPNGGPFTPDSIVYYIRNFSDSPIDFSVATSEPWLELDSTGGTVPVEGVVPVTLSITDCADSLPNGHYEDLVEFANETTHDGDTTRPASLEVGVPIPMIIFDFSTDPGWSAESQWAWGKPAGLGGEYGNPDPSAGYTGDEVYGYNLNGDYGNNLPEVHLTTAAIDCTNLTQVGLKFWRWLNVETPSYDHAYVRVSNDGENWTEVWQNLDYVEDAAWTQHSYDISGIADRQPTVYVRWTMGTTDGSWRYSGWNIDDVEIWGVDIASDCPADVNLDGAVDIDDLFQVLSAWGTCNGCPEDIDDDGLVDIDDVFAVLADWGPC